VAPGSPHLALEALEASPHLALEALGASPHLALEASPHLALEALALDQVLPLISLLLQEGVGGNRNHYARLFLKGPVVACSCLGRRSEGQLRISLVW